MIDEEPSTGLPSVALMTFSKSCRSCLSCLNATSLVSRMKSRSNNLFASIFAKGALKEMTMFVRRPLAVDDGANLGHLGPGVVGGGLLQEDGAQKIWSLRNRDEFHIAEEAHPLLLSQKYALW